MRSTMVSLRQQSLEKDDSIKRLNRHLTSHEKGRMPNSEDDVSSVEVIQAKNSSSSDFAKASDQNQQLHAKRHSVSAFAEQQLEEARRAHSQEKDEMKL